MKPLLTILGILAISSAGWAAPPTDLVQPELIAAATAVEPGKPFTVGLHLRVADGWHVYWINPGDAGAATTFKITAPAGFTVGQVQYPAPEIMHLAGGLTAYGYEKELLLTATITPPGDLKGVASVPISAAAGWCVCSDVCIIGKQNLELKLPVGNAKTANPEIFDSWKLRMPAASADVFASINYLGSSGVSSGGVWPGHPKEGSYGEKMVWKTDPLADNFQWIPGPCDDLIVKGGKITTDWRTTSAFLEIQRVQGISPASSTVWGILEYDVRGQPPRGVAVSFDRKSMGLPVP